MASIQFSAGAPTIQGTTPAQDFVLELSPDSQVIPGSGYVQNTVQGDVSVTYTYPDAYWEFANVVVSKGPACGAVNLSSSAPAVATVDQNGDVSPQANGSVTITASGVSGQRPITQTVARVTPTPQVVVNGYVAGSLRKYLYDQQVAALAGVTPGATSQRVMQRGSSWAPGGWGSQNQTNFLLAQEKDGFDAYPSELLEQLLVPGATEWKAWISPHHFLCWKGHGVYPPGGASWRSIDGEIAVEYSPTAWTGRLCKLLPANLTNWVPSVTPRLPCWALLWNTYIGADGSPLAERRWAMPIDFQGEPYPVGDFREPYQKRQSSGVPMINSGDSGSPVFANIYGNVVPITHVANQGVFGRSPAYHEVRAQIDAAMAQLNASGLYTAQTVSLNDFQTFTG